jgi:hypothetical protein
MAYHTTGTLGFFQKRVPWYVRPAFSITRRAAVWAAAVTLMIRARPCCSKPKRNAARAPSVARPRPHQARCSSKPTSILSSPGPVIEIVEAEPADPATSRLVDGRPRAEAVHPPLSHATVGEPGDSVRRHVPPAPDRQVAKETLKVHGVFLAPRPQDEPLRFQGAREHDHRRLARLADVRPPAGVTMTVRPASTSAMPVRRSGPNRSPNTSADDAAPTNGTSSANGATWAAG